MLELCSIASGSSGNCICVGTDDCHVLIDAGISGKKIENGLNEFDMTATDMQGILVTHEHIDHIAGLGVMARRYHIPIYATKATIGAIKCTKSVGNIDDELFHPVCADEKIIINDIDIITPKNIVFPATLDAFFKFPLPKFLESDGGRDRPWHV